MKYIKTIFTGIGHISPISISGFLNRIKVKSWDAQWLPRYFKKASLYRSPDLVYPSYEIVRIQFSKKPIKSCDLIEGLPIKDVPYRTLLELVEDIVTESSCEMGEPTYLVRLQPRIWMAANPKDFEIHQSNAGKSVVNYFPSKSIVYRISKKT